MRIKTQRGGMLVEIMIFLPILIIIGMTLITLLNNIFITTKDMQEIIAFTTDKSTLDASILKALSTGKNTITILEDGAGVIINNTKYDFNSSEDGINYDKLNIEAGLYSGELIISTSFRGRQFINRYSVKYLGDIHVE